MNHDRAQNVLSGQTSLARKVFAVVPMQSFWSVNDISNEMARIESHNYSRGEITGCLRCLVDAGLVSENGNLTFRSNVKPPKEKLEMLPVKPERAFDKATVPLLDRIANKAAQLRTLADDLDDLALEVNEAINAKSADSEKLHQLQATLRGLMGNG